MANNLLVIGAGPKGIAIGSKHRALGPVWWNCRIFERWGVGAQWTQEHGFTDGRQRLVTLPQHDVGYPYCSDSVFDSIVNDTMHRFSWEVYLSSKEKRAEYLLNDEKHPTHEEFVHYLRWVSRTASLDIERKEIKGIRLDGNQWELSCEENEKYSGFGLVVTGHGGEKRFGNREYLNPRILHGKNFWLADNLALLEEIEDGDEIAVVGAGEAAGAIAVAILDRLTERGYPRTGASSPHISLICRRQSYFTRSAVFKDVKYFSNPTGWQGIPIRDRRAIIDRADRGVVSNHVKSRLESSELVSYTQAEIHWPRDYEPSSDGEIDLELRYESEFERIDLTHSYKFVVFALGFDDMWFLDLFDEISLNKLISHIVNEHKNSERYNVLCKAVSLPCTVENDPLCESLVKSARESKVKKALQFCLEYMIDYDLSVKGFRPKLHLPKISGFAQGPGFPTLQCLGLMSDRILCSYAPIRR